MDEATSRYRRTVKHTADSVSQVATKQVFRTVPRQVDLAMLGAAVFERVSCIVPELAPEIAQVIMQSHSISDIVEMMSETGKLASRISYIRGILEAVED